MSDDSPDIPIPSKNILRYSDVEATRGEHSRSRQSSDSAETFQESEEKDRGLALNASFLQHLTLTPGVSGSSVESSGQISVSSGSASEESREVIQDVSSISRPESLSLSRSTSERKSSESEPSAAAAARPKDAVAAASHGSSHQNIQPKGILSQRLQESDHYSSLSQSLPQGTITRKGDLIEFVASDLQEKIKQSSPLSQPDATSSGSRRSSIKSFASASSSTSFATSSGLSHSPSSLCQQSPDDIPPIDAAAVVELENHATRVADSLDLMMGNIRNNLHKMSAITIGCQDAYKRSVDITCDSVDGSIKTMYALMAKCEELSASMAPVQQLANQMYPFNI
ncbi:Bloc-1-related complex subunit 6 [Plakobranchus ocellatus]|uniref:Bloc-1-related complex subunit 6 n=1 Tax=Plakobranchus ocellatus TaxID=259542 RepID=A0AAV3Z2P5_9GAST|nr:Bloc-1-related complex subunit 6 [Plakobranchus ocellatus]